MRLNVFNSVMILALTLLAWQCGQPEANQQKEGLQSYAEMSNDVKAVCNPKWFPHSQTPAPAEGKNSPFDTSSTTNSIFHEWSWQKFLWLTKPSAGDKLLFEDQLTWVTSHMEPLKAPEGVSVVLSSDEQAAHNAVLRSNPTFGSKEDTGTVYYGIAVDSILLSATREYIETIKADTAKFLNNEFTFPVGTLELKTAWIRSENIPLAEQADYYITNAYNTITSSTHAYALLGMHVVGVVENHPEFIWATFEHDQLAPNYNWAETTTQKDVPVTSNENRMFFKKGSRASIQDLKYKNAETVDNVFSVFPLGIPRTFRDSIMPNTAQSTASNRSNLQNIQALNTCVKQNLGASSVWSNYFYNGSIWIDMDGKTHEQQVQLMLDPSIYSQNASSGKPMRGSLAAFNITMETYGQEFGQDAISTMLANNLVNCFTCHTSTSGLTKGAKSHSPLYVSHIFDGALKMELGANADQIEMQRIIEAIEDLDDQQ